MSPEFRSSPFGLFRYFSEVSSSYQRGACVVVAVQSGFQTTCCLPTKRIVLARAISRAPKVFLPCQRRGKMHTQTRPTEEFSLNLLLHRQPITNPSLG